MKLSLPAIADTALVGGGVFAATFTITRFYSDSLWLPIVVAVLCGVFSAVVFRLIAARRSYKYALKASDRARQEEIVSSLCLMREDELNEFFSLLLDKMQLPYETRDGVIVLSRTNTALRYYFTFSKTGEERITEYYKQADKGQSVLVLGREFSEELNALTRRFAGRIKLMDGAALYLCLKRFECFPPLPPPVKKVKPKILPTFFSRKRAKQYLLYGLTLEAFSFLVLYPLYYAVAGGVLIALSIGCFFFGLKDAPVPDDNPFRK